jgi:site-specific DNA recombinase
MIKCVVYARVSTDEQASGQYSSVESQIDICKHYIEIQKEKGWQFIQAYTDPGFSGKDLERPGIQSLIEDIKASKLNVVIVYKIERLVRSIKDFYALWDLFEAHNVTFVSATQQFDTSNAMGKLMLNILLSFAQFERENTSEKTRDKMKQRARLGKWHGGWFPFGYDYNKETKKLVINKKETQAVRKIFEQFIEGRKPSEIANLLNSKGIRTKTRTIKTKDDQTKNIGENRLNEDFIKKILSNPLYKGFVEFANEEFKGEHEAIISTTTWDKANKMLKPVIPRRIEYAKDSHIHLLKGLAKCGECDVSLTPYPGGKKDKNGNPYLYYACGKVVDIGKESPCKVRLLPAREFEKAVKDALIELGKNKPLIDSAIKNNSKLTKTRIKPLQAEMNKTEQALIDRTAQINRLVKVLKSKDMVSKEVSEEYKRMLSERSLLETQKEKLVLDIERCKQDMLDAELIRKTLLSFDKVVGSLPIEDQKDLFQLLIKQITVWSFDPTKEKAPKEIGAFVTKIRTRWFRIKLELYQFPEIEAYYRSIRERKASSDFHKNWLPLSDDIRNYFKGTI